MQVDLPSDLRAFVDAQLASGQYTSVDDVVAGALTLLRDAERLRAEKLEALRVEVDKGLKELERGEYEEFDDDSLWRLCEQIKKRGRKRLAQQVASRE